MVGHFAQYFAEFVEQKWYNTCCLYQDGILKGVLP
jgi:hypothetical protein